MSDRGPVVIIGTADTKADEIQFMRACIERDGGTAAVMDVGVLGEAPFAPEYSKHVVAQAAGATIEHVIELGDENRAMAKMAEGAAALALRLYQSGELGGVLALGGTMGTDLALDVAAALPLGVPKIVLSTVSFSPLLPPERIAPDITMMLWAGGLYGLNSICKSVLSQAAGAASGAVRSVEPPQRDRPVIGMTSLGSSSLKYMVKLKSALEQRGYEVAVFHTTGMGGRAFEFLAAQKYFAAVMDFSLVEVSNHCHGSVVTAGADRLQAAGAAAVPQMVAPGGVSLIDMQAWAEVPAAFADREIHHHNRLIACALMTEAEKHQAAKVIAEKINQARGPATVIMPLKGIDEWDRPGGPFHAPAGLAAFAETLRQTIRPPVDLVELDAHINDDQFAESALETLDRWVADGSVPAGNP